MASFNRKDYEDVYRFTATMYIRLRKGKATKSALIAQAIHIMDICETVIGQQWHRPDRQVPLAKKE